MTRPESAMQIKRGTLWKVLIFALASPAEIGLGQLIPISNLSQPYRTYAIAVRAVQELAVCNLDQFNNTLGDEGQSKWYGCDFDPGTGRVYCAPASHSHVFSVAVDTNEIDITTMHIGPTSNISDKYSGIVYCPLTGKLYCAPDAANNVLVISGRENTTSTLQLNGSSTDAFGNIVFVPSTGKLYAAPSRASSILTVDPLTNSTSTTGFGNFTVGGSKWIGFVYASIIDMLVGIPYGADSVLFANPASNSTDTTSITGLSVLGGSKWVGGAYFPLNGKIFAAPFSTTCVLIIDTLTRTVDLTSLCGIPDENGKWVATTFSTITNKMYSAPYSWDRLLITDPVRMTIDYETIRMGRFANYGLFTGIVFVPTVKKLFTASWQARDMLVCEGAVDNRTFGPLRANEELANLISTTQSSLQRVCNRPVCGAGTRASNGTCIPDCDAQQRLGFCSPQCGETSAESTGSASGDNGALIPAIVAAVVVILAIFGVVLWTKHKRTAPHEHNDEQDPEIVAPEPAPEPPNQQRYGQHRDPGIIESNSQFEEEHEAPHYECPTDPPDPLTYDTADYPPACETAPSSTGAPVRLNSQLYVADASAGDNQHPIVPTLRRSPSGIALGHAADKEEASSADDYEHPTIPTLQRPTVDTSRSVFSHTVEHATSEASEGNDANPTLRRPPGNASHSVVSHTIGLAASAETEDTADDSPHYAQLSLGELPENTTGGPVAESDAQS